ncbi:hypothetical protein STXM2123_5341 [Streptomyces sp. F-3]|nr:hypothetical protein STXM2123_5341 [Streptomyces sp. F-3]
MTAHRGHGMDPSISTNLSDTQAIRGPDVHISITRPHIRHKPPQAR